MDLGNLNEVFLETTIKELYGLKVCKLSRLPGYSDINYYLQKECENKELILKIKEQSINEDVQLVLMRQLSEQGFCSSTLIKTLTGDSTPSLSIKGDDNQERVVYLQLLNFVEGKPISKLKFEEDKHLALMHNVGKFCGLVANQMQGLKEPDKPMNKSSYPKREIIWNTEFTSEILRFVHHVKDEEIVRITLEFVEMFQKKVESCLHLLRQGYIHGDFNDQNLLLCDKRLLVATPDLSLAEEDLKKGFGLIDFENCSYSYVVFDIAVCIAYFMMCSGKYGISVHENSRTMLEGYVGIASLTANELDVLPLCVLARLIASFVMSEYNSAEDPDNEHVYKAQARFCPRIIKDIWSRGVDNVLTLWS